MKEKITLDASKLKKEKRIKKITKLILLILILLLLAVYFIVGIIYNNGNFSITLDKNLYFEKNIIVYDNLDYKVYQSEIYAEVIETFDNISYKWLPNDLDDHIGSHNGENYVAHSFFVENMGSDVSDMWSEIIIDDVIKNVDEAVRVRVYKDGVPTTYAKISGRGVPEEGTVPFESDTLIALDHIENFAPGDVIKYTVVLWLEGSDPECVENIVGGEIKIHMNFNSEFIGK